MILYYLLLAPCLSRWYSTIFYRPTAFHYGTHLPSTGPLPISIVLYYFLLFSCLFLWYTTFFYWLTAYTYGSLLSSTDLLPITTVLYYHLLAPCLSLSYFTTFYWPHCLYLWYSTIFYLLPAYPYSSILPSTGPLSMLCYCTIF